MITPFDSEGRVEEDALSDLVGFQVTKGAQGLYPCGSTGLGPLLKADERKKVAEIVVREAAGRVPVVVQVGAADTSSTVELAKHAERVGADSVASLTPYYYKPGERAIVRHFEAVSRAVDIPLFAYNIPQFTGNDLLPSMVANLASRGTVAGIKDSSRDFLHLLAMLESVPDEFIVMNGTEEYALFALMIGADGLVSGGANAFPELFNELVAAALAKNHGAALAAQQRVLKVKDIMGSAPIATYYHVLRERGLDCGDPRAPLLDLSNAEKHRVNRQLRDIKLLKG